MEAPSKAAPEGARTPSRRIIYAWALLAAALWVSPALSFAGPPTEQIRGTIDRAIEILKDPSLAAKGKKEERRGLLRKEIEPAFDFPEMAKRSLGPNWRGGAPEERGRVVALFRGVVENSYLGQVLAYQGAVLGYTEET